MKHAVLADGNIGTGISAHFVCRHADREDGHVADIVGGRNHAERHDRTVAESVVGLPVILVGNTALVTIGMAIAYSEVADDWDGRDAIVFIIVPDGIIATVCSLFVCGHSVGHIGGTHTKVVVLPPIGAGAGTDVSVSSGHIVADHGFT